MLNTKQEHQNIKQWKEWSDIIRQHVKGRREEERESVEIFRWDKE
jgi:hypothetical protein